MPGAQTDILRRPADLRPTARTTGRTRPRVGQSTIGCTTATGRRLVATTRSAVAVAAVPPLTRTPCRR